MTRPTIAEILLPALRKNLSLAGSLAQGAEVIPVVKADAYGHGAVAISRELTRNGITNLAVACIEEAVELSDSGVSARIIILGPLFEDELAEIMARRFIPVVSCISDLDMIEQGLKSKTAAGPIEAIIDVDTGMGRMGFLPEEMGALAERLGRMSMMRISGIFSHLPVSESAEEEDVEYTRRQLQDFSLMAKAVQRLCPEGQCVSIANSGALLFHDDAALGAARPGIMLYGVRPAHGLPVQARLEPVMRWTTRIAQVRRLPAGSSISYGRKTVLKRKSCIALLPVGYADGLGRKIPPGFNLFVRGRPAPIAGVVTMDLTMIDVTDVPGAAVGDRVLIMGQDVQSPGSDNDQAHPHDRAQVQITAEDHARAAGTIPYEILTSVGKRVKRIIRDES